MTRVAGYGQARPKRPLPSGSASHPAVGGPSSRPGAGDAGASSRSGRGEAFRLARSLEFYQGTSLHCPPPPKDPARDPRLPLLGMPGDGRRREAERLLRDEEDRQGALRAELVARQPVVLGTGSPRLPERRLLGLRSPDPRSMSGVRAGGTLRVRTAGMMSLMGPVPLLMCVMRTGGCLAKKKKKPKKKKAALAVPGVAICPAPTAAPEQVAPELPSQVSRHRTRDETMCINCGCAGNFRSECEDPPRCPSTLAYLWYGTEGGSFYYVDAKIEEEAVRLHLVTITLAPEQVLPTGVVISADLIQAELAAYIGDFRDSDFAWEVIETAPLVFSVPFPSAALLRVCSHDLIRCPINKFMISVHAAVAEPDPVPPLEVYHLAEVATNSGIVFRGKKGPILEQISAICAKEKLEGALAEARACVARGKLSSPEHTDPGHRHTRGGAAPPVENVVGTPLTVPPR
ncbi:hypothetical protein D1007_44668 [Hordeum vulgare]|nr:hypothetical protein D1007_44668 [Hordeum vulgare]